jgi:hypothetical protein
MLGLSFFSRSFLIVVTIFTSSLRAQNFKTGDVIFHQSQSSQSAALKEATGSVWTHVGVIVKEKDKLVVVEARNGVEVTKLQDFIDRGINKTYVVKRLPRALTKTEEDQIKKELYDVLGTGYDVYFEWNDKLIYCSELVWKIYSQVLNIKLTSPQKMKELKLDGPNVQKLIIKRYTSQGRQVNMNEPVVTPVALLNSKLLVPAFTE